jgi:hypothetical protein
VTVSPPSGAVDGLLRGLEGLAGPGDATADEAERALELLGKVNVKRYGHSALLPRVWQLRNRTRTRDRPVADWRRQLW